MSVCGRCGALFGCAMADAAASGQAAAAPCWCTLLPAAAPLPREAQAGCWCAHCLRRFIDDSAADFNAAAADIGPDTADAADVPAKRLS